MGKVRMVLREVLLRGYSKTHHPIFHRLTAQSGLEYRSDGLCRRHDERLGWVTSISTPTR
ncbi:hypothetical protein M758_2G020700 [Ceratodon purpureus]|uniref:Uncharacterized protein n=1 Tax=Ceratodon purpureus TaxID=3225 RepID=A0A8T0IRX4_CERPU|nr:hypothetical protein KC19_2G021400 [Ceratodon purpureus]KAG0625009.1 hypothetical protein M758_2G020700 [Ceratodon purpureus]